MVELTAYAEGLTDSSRWKGFELRPGDIVISVPSKCGTTWLQMMCAVLIFGPKLPGALTQLSPWLDMRLRPSSEVHRHLAGQRHRRFIKTHTPLDGIPFRKDVTYLVMGRDPRDVAVSMGHHRRNLDEAAIHEALGVPAREADAPVARMEAANCLRAEALAWIESDRPLPHALSTLKGMTWHLDQAWRRQTDPNVVLLHYAKARADPRGTMESLANRLGISVPEDTWPELVAATTFESMRANASALVPDEGLSLFKRPDDFFQAGSTQQWAGILTPGDLLRYEDRIASLAGQDLIAWLHSRA